jgi:methionine-rich copper-binding protein CopC
MEKDGAMEKGGAVMESFENVKSPHFLTSSPANNAAVPAGIVKTVDLTFDFDLAGDSKIGVTNDGKDVTTGKTEIVGDKLKLTVPVDTATAGGYKVTYSACWPDGSCHDGSFGFNVKA